MISLKIPRKIDRYFYFYIQGEACGPYGHDIHLREICAAWKRPPITEMTREEYESWLRVEKEVSLMTSMQGCNLELNDYFTGCCVET